MTDRRGTADLERLEELLAERATQGLSQEEQEELSRLAEGLEPDDLEGFDRAAAAVDLALMGAESPLPEGLRRKVETDARRFFDRPVNPELRRASGDRPAGIFGVRTDSETDEPKSRFPFPRPSFTLLRPRAGAGGGWWAAAAALLLAGVGWWLALQPVAGPGPASPDPTPDSDRSRLLVEAPDVVKIPWTATEDPAAEGVDGDVVWSTARQQGFLRIQGLAANDPQRSQYQLWIFDREREGPPVDGGVFDIPPNREGDVLVPIRAKLPVGAPTLFAVTVERPGGVVVSDRERIVLVAELG